MENNGTNGTLDRVAPIVNKFNNNKSLGIEVVIKKKHTMAVTGVDISIPVSVALKTLKSSVLSLGFFNEITEKALLEPEYKILLNSHRLLLALLEKALDIKDFADDVDFMEQLISHVSDVRSTISREI